jgi:hypothetical protein
MPLRRRFSRLSAVLAALGCFAVLAPAAGAAPALPAVPAGALATIDSTVAAAPPLREVTRQVAEQVHPAAGTVTPSGAHGSRPVAQTIAPIAEAATASAPPPAAAAASLPGSLREHARERVSGIAASMPAEHVSSERLAHGHGMNTVARYPSREPGAPAHDSTRPVAAASAAPERRALAPGLAPTSGIGTGAGGAAAGASSGFFFGGGFCLLVALLVLAGPGLRRRLSLPPAVCRPAAFLVVLERPG